MTEGSARTSQSSRHLGLARVTSSRTTRCRTANAVNAREPTGHHDAVDNCGGALSCVAAVAVLEAPRRTRMPCTIHSSEKRR